LVMDKVVANPNAKYLTVNVSIDNTNGVSRLNIHTDFLVELVKPIVAQINLKHFANGVYVKSFINIEVEACDFFKTSSSNPLANKFYEYARKFGKIATRCPIKKVTEFVVNNNL
jgi:dihydroorotate dehydrogenase